MDARILIVIGLVLDPNPYTKNDDICGVQVCQADAWLQNADGHQRDGGEEFSSRVSAKLWQFVESSWSPIYLLSVRLVLFRNYELFVFESDNAQI